MKFIIIAIIFLIPIYALYNEVDSFLATIFKALENSNLNNEEISNSNPYYIAFKESGIDINCVNEAFNDKNYRGDEAIRGEVRQSWNRFANFIYEEMKLCKSMRARGMKIW